MSGNHERSRDLGLSLARVLLHIDDLHYGLWLRGEEPDFSKLPAAQARYSDLLFDILSQPPNPPLKILEIGCGTGVFADRLMSVGHTVHAVNPSTVLNHEVRARCGKNPLFKLVEKPFERLDGDELPGPYDLILFSESFQYVPLPEALKLSIERLATNGRILVADFFKLDSHRKGGTGDRSMGGGHVLSAFYEELDAHQLKILRDDDLTEQVVQNLELLDRWLNERAVPATRLISDYLHQSRPWTTRLLRFLFRKKIARLRYKYLSGYRGSEVFRTFKSYRLFLLSR